MQQSLEKYSVLPRDELILSPEIRRCMEEYHPADRSIIRLAYGVHQLFNLPDSENRLSAIPENRSDLYEQSSAYLAMVLGSPGLLTGGLTERAREKRSEIDARIHAEVVRRVEQGGLRPRVLAIGCGLSYGGGLSDVREPWLERKLQLEYAEKILLLATDSSPSYEHLFVDADNRLCFGGSIPFFDSEMVTEENRGTVVQLMNILKSSRYSPHQLQENASGVSGFVPLDVAVREKIQQILGINLYSEEEGIVLRSYLRPSLDPVFERIVFGLAARRRVDANRLSDFFPQKFDCIFGRDLPPDTGKHEAWDIESMGNQLADGGSLMLQIGKRRERGMDGPAHEIIVLRKKGERLMQE